MSTGEFDRMQLVRGREEEHKRSEGSEAAALAIGFDEERLTGPCNSHHGKESTHESTPEPFPPAP
eukprot:5062851-Alexandrium_andersonii.AAC.2